jgi:hypothetical protein
MPQAPLGSLAAHGGGRSSLLALPSAPVSRSKILLWGRSENLYSSLLFSTLLYSIASYCV